jgi:hypothetical protein
LVVVRVVARALKEREEVLETDFVGATKRAGGNEGTKAD